MVDPNYPEVFDERNTARAGGGVILEKYTGSGGKAYASDAHPEFLAQVRSIWNKHRIIWQTNTIGKVDLGGGGTLALYIAKYNMNIVDAGIGVFNMHAPWEVVSKADLYEMYEGYRVFLEEA
jgi:aspartyl aminopeptidase